MNNYTGPQIGGLIIFVGVTTTWFPQYWFFWPIVGLLGIIINSIPEPKIQSNSTSGSEKK